MDSAERTQSAKHWFYGDRVVDLAERNSDEFPLGLLARSVPEGVKRLEFNDEITDSSTGERVKRTLVISANTETDLPSYWDLDVQKGLLALSHRQDRYEFPERVEFTIYGLLKVMQKKNSTANIHRVAKSLDNWNGVRFKYSHWWTGDTWDHPKAFLLLQDYDLSRRGNGARPPKTPQVFTWSRHYVESIRNSKYKPFDSDFYFSLKKPTTRRMFCFLDKRLSGMSHYTNGDLADFTTNKMGLGKRRASQCPDRLREAYDELVARGFLANIDEKKRFGGKDDYFFYCRRGKGEKKRSQVTVPLSLVVNNESGESPLIAELVKRKVEAGSGKTQATGLVAAAKDESLVRENIERYDALVAEGCEVTEGLLISAIRKNELLRLPKGVRTASQKELVARLTIERDQKRKTLAEAQEEWAELLKRAPIDAFSSLPADVRHEVMGEVVRLANVHARKRYESEGQGGEEILAERFRKLHRQAKGGAELTGVFGQWYEATGVLVNDSSNRDLRERLANSKAALDEARKALDEASF